MTQLTLEQSFQIAVQHHQAGQLQQAEQMYRQILARQPNHAGALHYLGLIAQQAGRNDAAVDLIRRCIILKPDWPEAYNNLGNALTNTGQPDEAIAACRQAIALRPNYPEAYYNLGIALKDKGQLDDAVAAWRQAIGLNPNFPEAHSNLGNALQAKGQLDQAIAAHRQAIALKPNYPQAFINLGNALREKGQLDDAVIAYREAIALKPNYPEAYNNLGSALKDKGQLDQAIAAYRQAIALKPDYSEAHSNVAYTVHFHSGYDAPAIAAEHRHWNQQHAKALQKFVQPHANDRTPGRRLRIGYVSPDLRNHPVGWFLLPLLANHDKSQVEVFAYAQVAAPDLMTQRLQSHVDGWRNIVGLADAQVADLVRQDQIDILVDLTMHTALNRLLVFAAKPAPVQVTYLAYCSTTGLDTIDYRLSDPYLDPPTGDESVYSERTMRLPETYWCYQPCINLAEVGPLPALQHRAITFGCLNNFCKVSNAALAVWAKLLLVVPNSQLFLHAHEGSHRQNVIERMGHEGIESRRIQFAGTLPLEEYFDRYRQIDIALDTFPCSGGTTTCDALWMGVPVVSLAGRTAVGRGGLSILSNLGLPELVASSQQEYVEIATELAGDIPRLSNLHSTLRQRMQQSTLMNAPRFTRNIEAAYRQMWHQWCATAQAPAAHLDDHAPNSPLRNGTEITSRRSEPSS